MPRIADAHLRRVVRRLRAAVVRLWPVMQQTAAASLAWVLATHLVDHHQPFFAPIAAVVALNASLGERGLNALRLLIGTVVGIVTGEVAIWAFGGGSLTLALAVFVAMAAASALDRARIVTAQAAAGAILTITTTSNGQAGPDRLVDALLGAGVALVFSQLLFPPEPVALVRRAETAALNDMAQGVALTARALEQDDEELADRALRILRDLRDRLAELSRTRRASSRVVRHSRWWRSQKGPVVRENENAGHLDLLGGSCLMLARVAATAPEEQRDTLASSIGALAGVLTRLAAAPGDRHVRQQAAEQALEFAPRPAGGSPAKRGALAAGTARLVAADVMAFSGVPPGEVLDMVEGDL